MRDIQFRQFVIPDGTVYNRYNVTKTSKLNQDIHPLNNLVTAPDIQIIVMFNTSLGMWRQGTEILHRRAQIRQNSCQAEQGGGTSGPPAPATRGKGGTRSVTHILYLVYTVNSTQYTVLHFIFFSPLLIKKLIKIPGLL